MEKWIYYKHKFKGIFWGLVDAFKYKPSRYINGNMSIYGLETCVSIRCPECRRSLAIGWGDGDVYYLNISSISEEFFLVNRCGHCLAKIPDETMKKWRRAISGRE